MKTMAGRPASERNAALPPPKATGLRNELRRARRFARPLGTLTPSVAVPPPMPAGRTIVVPGHGEMFARVSDPVPGAHPVLLLHGWTASSDLNWFRCFDPLAVDREVIAVDHQGHGRGLRTAEPFSLERCADAAAGVLDELGIDRAVVAGYSMGGPIALLLAQRHPEKVAGLVLAATALDWRTTVFERLQWRFLRIVEVAARFSTGRGIAQRIVRQAVEDDPSLEPWAAWLAAEQQRGYLPDLFGAGRALSLYDARPWAGSITAPATVILTTNDRLVRPRKQRRLALAMGAPVLTVNGDHDTALVGASEFVEVLVDAVRDVDERARAAADVTLVKPTVLTG
jgi:pimeloyl-ACP methyl ester carboxylesterase